MGSEMCIRDRSNCFFSYQANEILIISKGGTRFNLPMDQTITQVFPMAEGLMIEYIPKSEQKLNEILFFQMNRNAMDIE